MSSPNGKHVSAAEIKQAARGRELDILQNVGGIPWNVLDRRNHPCPKPGCGGTDRFRLVDADKGAVFCNRCFNKANGDFLAAVAHYQGVSFPAACKLVADYLGLKPSTNGQASANSNGKSKAKDKPATTYFTAEEAEASYSYLGKPSARWTYQDANGAPEINVLRWDLADGKKTIRPVSRIGRTWIAGGLPENRPLYKLPELPTLPEVDLPEGEKAADAHRTLGRKATTSSQGSKSVRLTDWKPLAGKRVNIFPDNDSDGEAYVTAVKAELAKLMPLPIVKVVRLPGLPPKGDIVEWVEAHGDSAEPESMREELERLIAATPIEELTTATVDEPTTETEEPTKEKKSFRFWTMAELDSQEFKLDYIVDGTLVAKQPAIISAVKKCMKTTVGAGDLGISIATGTPFLGTLNVPRAVRVGIMTAESGMATVQETLRRICWARGLEMRDVDGLIVSDEVPKVHKPDDLDALERFIVENELEVVFLDPVYQMMPGADAGNLFVQGELLGALTEVFQRAGSTPVLIHHNKKTGKADPFSHPELDDIAWSGFAEFARQWLLLGRREAYEPGTGNHKLWLNVGGSAGHSSLWAVDVDEGEYKPGQARTYDVVVTRAEEARKEAKRRQAEAKEADKHGTIAANMLKITNYLKGKPDGDTPKAIRMGCSLNPTSFNGAIGKLFEQQAVEECRVLKPGGSKTGFEGYRLTNKQQCSDELFPE